MPAARPTAADPSVWPASTTEPARGDLAVGGVPLTEIADRCTLASRVRAELTDACATAVPAFWSGGSPWRTSAAAT
ncbi:hypothetical protein [Streptomyces tendae]|uniref:hypothetical protein n=1 Tax=Streptomyces tendae TaxID=1932 RepID=UPI00371E0559